VSSDLGVIVMGKPELPSPLEVVYNSSTESSRMVHIDGDPLCAIPMKMAPESFPWENGSGY
jgi:hypothetical protein